MVKKFERKRTIERATLFKCQYMMVDQQIQVAERVFNSAKALAQWVERNENGYDILECRRLAFIDEIWEPYTTIGKKTLTLQELRSIIRTLEGEVIKVSKTKK